MVKRIDRLADNTWVVKNKNYESVEKLQYTEEKLEFMRQLLNTLLEEYSGNQG